MRDPEDALDLVAEAKSRRSTASTAANATSSRSHCVTRITVWNEAFGQGQLTLVDCAGSERNNDSMHHDAQARKESAEINSSLYALRECIRLRRRQAEEARQPNGGKHVHVPYRSSQLTRVLMECFTTADASVAVIATVLSPPGPAFLLSTGAQGLKHFFRACLETKDSCQRASLPCPSLSPAPGQLAQVSPSSTDTEHSISTLQTVLMMSGAHPC